MLTLQQQQAEAWRLAPDAHSIAQDRTGWWCKFDLPGAYFLNKEGFWLSPGKHDGRKIYRGVVNNWDWRDTLQTREEWEAMKPTAELDDVANPIKENWIPKVGQECEVQHIGSYANKWLKLKDVLAVTNEYVLGINEQGREVPINHINPRVTFRPIQTPADKYREEQIKGLKGLLDFQRPNHYHGELAEWLYKKGVRVLAPDEFPAKRLTDEQITQLIDKVGFARSQWNREIFYAVQNAMLGDEK